MPPGSHPLQPAYLNPNIPTLNYSNTRPKLLRDRSKLQPWSLFVFAKANLPGHESKETENSEETL